MPHSWFYDKNRFVYLKMCYVLLSGDEMTYIGYDIMLISHSSIGCHVLLSFGTITVTLSWRTYSVALLKRETFTAGFLFPALLFIWTVEQVRARHLLCCMVSCTTASYTCWTSHATSSCNDWNMFRHHALWSWRSLWISCISHTRFYVSDYKKSDKDLDQSYSTRKWNFIISTIVLDSVSEHCKEKKNKLHFPSAFNITESVISSLAGMHFNYSVIQ